MKTAKEWYLECNDPDYSYEFIAWLELIQADAREQGRRDGLDRLEKFANRLEDWDSGTVDGNRVLDSVRHHIRKLLEKPGGG